MEQKFLLKCFVLILHADTVTHSLKLSIDEIKLMWYGGQRSEHNSKPLSLEILMKYFLNLSWSLFYGCSGFVHTECVRFRVLTDWVNRSTSVKQSICSPALIRWMNSSCADYKTGAAAAETQAIVKLKKTSNFYCTFIFLSQNLKKYSLDIWNILNCRLRTITILYLYFGYFILPCFIICYFCVLCLMSMLCVVCFVFYGIYVSYQIFILYYLVLL